MGHNNAMVHRTQTSLRSVRAVDDEMAESPDRTAAELFHGELLRRISGRWNQGTERYLSCGGRLKDKFHLGPGHRGGGRNGGSE